VAVATEFGKFLRELEEREGAQGHSKSGSSSRAYNELFFAWQRDAWESNGRTVMNKYPEFIHLKAIMGVYIVNLYIQNTFLTPHVLVCSCNIS
jgi:hypothetical protein